MLGLRRPGANVSVRKWTAALRDEHLRQRRSGSGARSITVADSTSRKRVTKRSTSYLVLNRGNRVQSQQSIRLRAAGCQILIPPDYPFAMHYPRRFPWLAAFV